MNYQWMSGHLTTDSKRYKTRYLPKPENSLSFQNLSYPYFLFKNHPQRIKETQAITCQIPLDITFKFSNKFIVTSISLEPRQPRTRSVIPAVQGPQRLLPPTRCFPVYSWVTLGRRLNQNDNVNVYCSMQRSPLLIILLASENK